MRKSTSIELLAETKLWLESAAANEDTATKEHAVTSADIILKLTAVLEDISKFKSEEYCRENIETNKRHNETMSRMYEEQNKKTMEREEEYKSVLLAMQENYEDRLLEMEVDTRRRITESNDSFHVTLSAIATSCKGMVAECQAQTSLILDQLVELRNGNN